MSAFSHAVLVAGSVIDAQGSEFGAVVPVTVALGINRLVISVNLTFVGGVNSEESTDHGGYARVGGGAFSGKDPTKVDRSGAYAARYLAKHIVKEGLAQKAEVRLAYFIGAKKPTMQEVETFGTANASDRTIKDFVSKLLDTSVEGILQGLDLQRPIYLPTSTYGHFGREEFPWEK